MYNLPEELILHIIAFLPNNKNTCILPKCFRCIKHNYLKSITLSKVDNISKCIEACNNHKDSLLYLTIENISNPFNLFISTQLPNVVNIIRCNLTDIVDPIISSTRKLVIYDSNRHNNRNKIIVNWCKFPKLVFLDIYAYDICLTDIEKCVDLQLSNINLICDKK